MGKKSDSNKKKSKHLGATAGAAEVTEPVEVIQGPEESDGQGAAAGSALTGRSCDDKVSDYKINECLPALNLEQYEPDVDWGCGVNDRIKGSTHFAWIGAGHCGTRLAKSFYDLGYRKVLAVDSTQHDLDSLDIPEAQKLLIYMRQSDHSSNIEVGQKAIQQHKQDILNLTRQIFGSELDHIMICFGAGGDTGSASVAGLIDVAKRYARYIGLENPSKRVGVVMTLPAVSKVTRKVVEKSSKLASWLGQMAAAGKISPFIIIDNNKINKMYSGITLKSSWQHINSDFAGLFDVFNRFSALSSQYTSFDSLDYRRVMQAGGCVVMGTSEVTKLDDPFAISEAVEDNLHETLHAGRFDLSTAKEAGCIVVGGKDLMTNVKGLQKNIDYAFDVLSNITGQATMRRGIYEDNSNSLMVYTIVAGLAPPKARQERGGEDSYYRMKRVKLRGQPLNRRTEDILPLAEYFLAKQADAYEEPHKFLSLEAEELLLNYAWPGDVAELAGAMEHAYVLSTNQHIEPAALPLKIIFADFASLSRHTLLILYQTRRDIVTRAIDFAKGRRPRAAKILGLEDSRLNHLVKELKISFTNKSIVPER